MSEIKSAIELAMERTKNLVMDEKEKQEFAQRDLEEKLRALVRRFMEGMIGPDGFLSEYGGMRVEKRQKRALLIDMIIAEFPLVREKERLFELLELVGEEAGGGLAGEARALRDRFAEELARRIAGVREDIMRRLKEIGISGQAVEPNVEEWEEWRDAVLETGSLFERRLREWKDKAERVSS